MDPVVSSATVVRKYRSVSTSSYYGDFPDLRWSDRPSPCGPGLELVCRMFGETTVDFVSHRIVSKPGESVDITVEPGESPGVSYFWVTIRASTLERLRVLDTLACQLLELHEEVEPGVFDRLQRCVVGVIRSIFFL